jgi:hypothetical protein
MKAETVGKRGSSARRIKFGADLDIALETHRRMEAGEDLDLIQKKWVADLLKDILSDLDVRSRFWQSRRGAPAEQDRHFWCAMWIDAERSDGRTIEEVKQRAVKKWRLTESQVDRAWKDHRKQVREIRAKNHTPGWQAVIEMHRVKGR